MKYDTITLNCFITQNKTTIVRKNTSLTIASEQNDGFPGVTIKNIEFDKESQYTLHIDIKLHNNIYVYFYTSDQSNKKILLTNGDNILDINIGQQNIIDILFIIHNPTIGSSFDINDIIIKKKINNLNQMINNHFNENIGFGKYKSIAVKLLKETIKILDEFNIDYCLISGTLLGYVRHNDFIPWDDDIDLIVDESIITKLPDIIKKYNTPNFYMINSGFIKSFYEKRIVLDNEQIPEWPKRIKWTWPFIDLFTFKYSDDKKLIYFYYKTWDANNFFPLHKKLFLDINVSIPINPTYFLEINYGNDYMNIAKSSIYCHKSEKMIGNEVKIPMKLLKYNDNNI